MLYKVSYYFDRIRLLGLQKSAIRVGQKVKESYLKIYWRKKAYNNTAVYSWQQIAKKHTYAKSSSEFCTDQANRRLTFLPQLYTQVSEKKILADADLFANNCFDLLGSGLQQFKKIPWHTDFRFKAQHKNSATNLYEFDPTLFYQDRPSFIHNGQAVQKDIKIPWELSRCYHFSVLGHAYKLTGNKKYTDVFYEHIADWIEHNQYLFGINWMCPMEVGLRAVNWVIALQYFVPTKDIITSLYNHLIYLENHWEVYDGRTSNHYLSNLIGYFYLCWFFQDLPGMQKKRDWCYTEFLKEWDKQIFDEGTDYEGSTAYHRLVTEILYHFYLLCQEFGMLIPEKYKKKLMRMFDFIRWCTPYGGELITIGDDDSGRVLWYGLSLKKDDSFGTREYKEFGLSIIKTKQWHITLRQHAYQKKQPNGHYHADVGSITLVINGIPLFIDPGSYLYTPSLNWRNYFRAYQNHNTFFLKDVVPINVDEKFFMLQIPENKWELHTAEPNNILQATHSLYTYFCLEAKREVGLYKKKELNRVKITDSWNFLSGLSNNKSTIKKEYTTCWNFILGPNITPKKKGTKIVFFYKNTILATVPLLDLAVEISDAWVAPSYGTKIKTKCLRLQKDLAVGDIISLVIETNN